MLQFGKIAGQTLPLLHVGAGRGEFRFLPLLRGKRGEFGQMREQQVTIRRRLGDGGAAFVQRVCRAAPRLPRRFHARNVSAGIAIEQLTVAARVDQAAVIMLAVQFHQERRQFAQQGSADRLVVDEGLGPAIRFQPALDQQRFAGLHVHFRFGQHGANAGGQLAEFKTGGDAGLFLAPAHQSAVGAVAQHQPQRIEQDRLARPGFAGQHAQPGAEIEVQRLDQHDVADG